MRRRAEHRRSTDEKFVSSRHGFTLIEVVVATAILLIILVPLMASFGRGVAGFKNAQLFTFAQNLAEFQAEDVKSLAPSVLNQLVQGTYPGTGLTPDNPLVVYSNYPAARKVGDPDYDSALDAAAATNDALDYMYDSGDIATEFNLIGLTKIVGDPYVAGPSLAPTLPTGFPMLGPNIEILPYEDVDYAATHWRYYRAVLHKEAYPLFTKRIQVTRYDANYLPDKTHHDASGDTSTLYDYTLTVNTRLANGSLKVLYVTQGTIGSSYTVTPTTVTVTAPLGGDAWANTPAMGTVSWTASGSTSGIFAYRVRLSTDDGATYGAPLAIVLASDPKTVDIDPGVADVAGLCRIMVEAISSKGQLLGYDVSAGFTIGAPPGPGGLFLVLVQQPTAASVWTVGNGETVRWSISGTPVIPVDQFSVELSTDGGSSYGPATVVAGGTSTSAILTPGAASANCVVRVTAQGVGGAPITMGAPVATSGVFATQSPLAITVTAPSASSVWTTNVPGTVLWSVGGSGVSIASYSISFIPAALGSAVTASAGATSANITATATWVGCVVRVTALDAGGSAIVWGDSAAFSIDKPLTVAVSLPAGGEKLSGGASYVVKWTTDGNRAPLAGFRILLSVDGGSTYAQYGVAPAVDYSGTIVLPGGSNYNSCYIRVEALNSGSAVIASGTSKGFQIKK